VAYRRLRALDITTAVPLLTWLATLDDSQLSLDDHVRTVLAIESWALRRAFVGWQTRGYGSLLAKVLKEAKTALSEGRPIADEVEGALQVGAARLADRRRRAPRVRGSTVLQRDVAGSHPPAPRVDRPASSGRGPPRARRNR
jgi:hypothetical protein